MLGLHHAAPALRYSTQLRGRYWLTTGSARRSERPMCRSCITTGRAAKMQKWGHPTSKVPAATGIQSGFQKVVVSAASTLGVGNSNISAVIRSLAEI